MPEVTAHTVKMAKARDSDLDMAWAVFRAAQRNEYSWWEPRHCDLEDMPRVAKLFFLRCWKLCIDEGAFNRIHGGYETLLQLCDSEKNVLELHPQLMKAQEDAELLPIYEEAYREALLVINTK